MGSVKEVVERDRECVVLEFVLHEIKGKMEKKDWMVCNKFFAILDSLTATVFVVGRDFALICHGCSASRYQYGLAGL